MSLKNQRRMAAKILKVGENRVWIDPDKIEDIELAISREEIRKLIHEKAIRKTPEKGVSRVRARILHTKRRKGKRRGHGSRKGTGTARTPKKEAWMSKIRSQRKRLRELKNTHAITVSSYRKLYAMAKSGAFSSISDLNQYIDSHNLRRRR